MNFQIKPDAEIIWSNGSCGNSGCIDPDCCCALCGFPIGVSDEDPRWNNHEEYCGGCGLCEDAVPIILFRGEGKSMKQANFHNTCFSRMLIVESKPTSIPQRQQFPQ